MIFTGTLPSLDSDCQNQDQNVLIALKSYYDNLGDFLLDECAFGDRERIVALVTKLDLDWVKRCIDHATTQPGREEDVFEHFCVCVRYLRDPQTTLTQESGNMQLIRSLRRRCLLPRPIFLGPFGGCNVKDEQPGRTPSASSWTDEHQQLLPPLPSQGKSADDSDYWPRAVTSDGTMLASADL